MTDQNLSDLVQVETRKPSISLNYEAAKKRINAEVARYDVIVTSDTVRDARAMATELNQTASAIDERRKGVRRELLAVFEPVNEQLIELRDICQRGRVALIEQIDVFDKAQCDTARALLEKQRDDLYDQHQVRDAFQSVVVEDLVKRSALTAKGALTKASSDAVTQRVIEASHRQVRVDRRVSDAENRSFRAGLSAPIDAAHYRDVLHDGSDDDFNTRVDRAIDRELGREAEAERLRQAQAERERRQAEARENEKAAAAARQSEPERPPEASPSSSGEAPASDAPPSETPDADGQTRRRAWIEADFLVPAHVDNDKLRERLIEMLGEAGIRSVNSIEVRNV